MIEQVVDCYTHVRNVGQNIILGCAASGWGEYDQRVLHVCTYTGIISCRAIILAKEEASTWRTIDRRINTSPICPFHARSGTYTAMVQGRQKRGGEDKDTSFVVHEVIEESNQCQSQMKFDTQLLDVWTKWIVPENCNDRRGFWTNYNIERKYRKRETSHVKNFFYSLYFFLECVKDLQDNRDLQDKRF